MKTYLKKLKRIEILLMCGLMAGILASVSFGILLNKIYFFVAMWQLLYLAVCNNYFLSRQNTDDLLDISKDMLEEITEFMEDNRALTKENEELKDKLKS